MVEAKPRCAKVIYDNFFSGKPCSRPGTIEEEGELWCKQHAPSAVKKRVKERAERWEAEMAEKNQREMDRAWNLVIKKLWKMNPKLAEELRSFHEAQKGVRKSE